MPAISVLVPIYNVERYLGQALSSLRAQTLADIEIICIDDGSTDASPTIVAEHAAADDRIRVITKANSGYGDSMNRGIAEARGEWIGICEPDDYCLPEMLEKLYEQACLYPGRLDIVKGAYIRLLERSARAGEGNVVERHGCGYLRALPNVEAPFVLADQPRLISFHPSIWTCLFRRDFLLAGGKDGAPIEFLPIPGAGWSDNPFMLETHLAAQGIAYVDEPLYCYRESDDGTISHLSAGAWETISGRWFDMERVLERYQVHDQGILEAHWCRGCAYIQMLDHDFADVPQAMQEADRMAQTIDYNTVFASAIIPQDYKDAYQNHVGLLGRAMARLGRLVGGGPEGGSEERHEAGASGVSPKAVAAPGDPSGVSVASGPGSPSPSVPAVSVLVPIYNVERYLDQALSSLRAQTLADIEIICIDDGSTDASPSIIAEHAAADSRIRTITKENSGYGDSMNRGIAAARGEWVGICEPDDFVAPEAFAAYLAAAQASPEVDVVKANHYEVAGDAAPPAPGARPKGAKLVANYDVFPAGVAFSPESRPDVFRTIPAIWAGIYRRRMLLDAGVSLSATPGAAFQDTSFVHQVWMAARRVVVLHEGYAFYRVDNQASSSLSTNKVFVVCDEYDRSLDILRRYGGVKQLLFEPMLQANRVEAYYWNYNRIAPECHLAFAQRMGVDLAAAQRAGMLHKELFSQESWRNVCQVMEDPQAFCQEHPSGV